MPLEIAFLVSFFATSCKLFIAKAFSGVQRETCYIALYYKRFTETITATLTTSTIPGCAHDF